MENNTNKLRCNVNGITIYTKKIIDTMLLGLVFKINIKFKKKIGLPHLFEHILVNQILKSKNILISGSTTNNNIAIKVIGNKDMVYNSLSEILSSISTPRITKEQLELEKLVVKQEILDYENSNIQSFASIARSRMFDNSKLHDKVLGNLADIDDINLEDINYFVDTNIYYKNIRILIVGSNDYVGYCIKKVEQWKISKKQIPNRIDLNIITTKNLPELSN